MAVDAASQTEADALREKVSALEAALAATKSDLATATEALSMVAAERGRLRRAYELLKGELELLRRRLFVAKAERIDTTQLELEFAATKAKLDRLARVLEGDVTGIVGNETHRPDDTGSGRPTNKKNNSKGGGRPDLKALDLVEERVEITDPALEGTAERIGFEETYLLGRRRACNIRIVLAKATYKRTTTDADGHAVDEFTTAPKPLEVVERGMLAPSFIAYLLTKKYRWGMPFHRVALELAAEGFSIDDSTMGRYAEHVGATLGCIVDAMAN